MHWPEKKLGLQVYQTVTVLKNLPYTPHGLLANYAPLCSTPQKHPYKTAWQWRDIAIAGGSNALKACIHIKAGHKFSTTQHDKTTCLRLSFSCLEHSKENGFILTGSHTVWFENPIQNTARQEVHVHDGPTTGLI